VVHCDAALNELPGQPSLGKFPTTESAGEKAPRILNRFRFNDERAA